MPALKHHPIASQFPTMSQEEMVELIADVKANGLRQAIVTYQGQILDGRHRYQACDKAGVRKKFEIYRGNDPVAFCISANLKRRHLTVSQRAMIAVGLETYKHGGDRKSEEADQQANLPVDRTETAANLHVSPRLVSSAASIQRENPALATEVRNGNLTVHAAATAVARNRNSKKAASTNGEICDETGWPIPANLLEMWGRRDEVTQMILAISAVEKKLKSHYADNDILFVSINLDGAVMAMENIKMQLRSADLYAVCPECQGKVPENCRICKRRGFLNQLVWDTAVPIETKEMRQKMIEAHAAQ